MDTFHTGLRADRHEDGRFNNTMIRYYRTTSRLAIRIFCVNVELHRNRLCRLGRIYP